MFKLMISGTGSYVPDKKLTNFDLEKMVDTSNEWILTRTGISERRIASENEATSDLAYYAAKAALESAQIQPENLDFIIVATVTPDYPFPSVASLLQHRLGCRAITTFDVSSTCTGFLTVLEIADKYMQSGSCQHGLIIGADTLSRVTDYEDRSSCILFSDGAGAWIVSRKESEEEEGLLYTTLATNGEHFDNLYVPGGGSRYPDPLSSGMKNKIVMDGKKVFKLAVQSMAKSIEETLKVTQLSLNQIDWLIPHQANERIIDTLVRNIGFPDEKVITTFGGGLVWGSAVIVY